MANKVMEYLVIAFVIFTILQSGYLVYKVESLTPSISEYKGTAAASGVISLCLNTQPTVNLTPCNTTIEQNSSFSCTVGVIDPDALDSHNFTSVFVTSPSLFNITNGGGISFTPGPTETGNHTVNISLLDNSSCSNNFDSALYTFNVTNVNDPPFLSVSLFDVNFSNNETVRPFFLNNHFSDPDGDTLTYTVSGADEANITIQGSSEVIINSNVCDFQDVVFFIARDPSNLSATSNPVTITCVESSSGSGSDSGAGAGSSAASTGGGGGGGGSALICRSNYDCFDYTACSENNTKVKRCVDINGCEDEEFITVDCNYEIEQKALCTEDWLCGDWGECLINNSQYRECIDVNQCHTEFDKPSSSQACLYIPTCNDGVRNGDEIGIDCGGSCPACVTIETPAPIKEDKSSWTTLLTLLILFLLLSLLTYKYAHRQVYQVLARLGLYYAGRVEKQIMLDDKQRDQFLEQLKVIESHYNMESINDLTKEYVSTAKSYFFRATSLEIDSGKEDLLAMCEERKLNEHLTRVLASFFDTIVNIEFSTRPLDGYQLMSLIEEFREMILQTSEYSNDMIDATVTAYRIPKELYPLEKIRLELVNAYKALHFNELEIAAQKYMALLHHYEDLSDAEEDIVYVEIARLFQKIRYRAAWIRNM